MDPKKLLVIVAGPNGAGKSTFATSGAIQELLRTPEHLSDIEILNPDRLALELRKSGDTEADLSAARAMEAMVSSRIRAGKAVGIETVLSSDKYKPLLLEAKGRGYTVVLLFVYLRDPALHIGRVRYRTQMGGHAVPEDKIVSRYSRSIANFEWFAGRSDIVFLIDNSRDGRSMLAAEKPMSSPWRTYGELDVAPLPLQEAVERLIMADGNKIALKRRQRTTPPTKTPGPKRWSF